MFNAVLASGYYDPIHSGHIEYLELAKQYAKSRAAHLVVIVNNDAQAVLKKGKPFMSEGERLNIVRSLRCVDHAFIATDKDGSVCESIREAARHFKVVAFAKGGDRFFNEIPEAAVCKQLGIVIVDSLGAKIQSSSSLIAAASDKNAPTPVPITPTPGV
jgi:D-beta-D-heptose 7-phosphate kinase/D-beta-D-heptose 1-phosphate adenosyltransferase